MHQVVEGEENYWLCRHDQSIVSNLQLLPIPLAPSSKLTSTHLTNSAQAGRETTPQPSTTVGSILCYTFTTLPSFPNIVTKIIYLLCAWLLSCAGLEGMQINRICACTTGP